MTETLSGISLVLNEIENPESEAESHLARIKVLALDIIHGRTPVENGETLIAVTRNMIEQHGVLIVSDKIEGGTMAAINFEEFFNVPPMEDLYDPEKILGIFDRVEVSEDLRSGMVLIHGDELVERLKAQADTDQTDEDLSNFPRILHHVDDYICNNGLVLIGFDHSENLDALAINVDKDNITTSHHGWVLGILKSQGRSWIAIKRVEYGWVYQNCENGK